MMNGYEYKPMPKRCHLMHFNDNKFRFQSKRLKHAQDRGSVLDANPAGQMFASIAKAGHMS